MQKSRKTIVIIILFAALIIGAVMAWVFLGPQNGVSEGAKEITVTVVHGDGSKKDFKFGTDAEYLGQALREQKLVEGEEGEFGLFIKAVDGETADDSAEQWWCFADGDGNMLPTGIDMTNIADGDAFRAILTVGYDAFG